MLKAWQEQAGLIAAWQVTWIVKALSGESFDPEEINPYRQEAIRAKKSPAQLKHERDRAFEALGRALGDKDAKF